MEPRTGFEPVAFAFLRSLPRQRSWLGFGIYQAEPPGHVADAAALDMLYELLEARRVLRRFVKGGARENPPPQGVT